MEKDKTPEYDDLSWIDDEDWIATKGKRRRIKLLEEQLDDVKEGLEERVQIHRNLEKKSQREKVFKERKLDRVKKFGSAKKKDDRERELKEEIESLKKERWREQVRVWHDSRDLLHEARKINRDLTDQRLRLEDLKNYFGGDR